MILISDWDFYKLFGGDLHQGPLSRNSPALGRCIVIPSSVPTNLTFTSSFFLRGSLCPSRQLYWTGSRRTVSSECPTPDRGKHERILWTNPLCVLTSSSRASHCYLCHPSCPQPVFPRWEEMTVQRVLQVTDTLIKFPKWSSGSLEAWHEGNRLAAASLKQGEGEFTAQQELIRIFLTKSSLPF